MDEQEVPLRIGDEERQAAVDALITHREAGRLDSTEYEERQVVASRARTWAEVGPLFADLPQPHPAGMPAGLAVSGGSGVVLPPNGVPPVPGTPAVPDLRPEASGLLGSRFPRHHRETVMALTPFAAVALFMVTRQWMWFLMIPVMGILLFGSHDDPHGRRRKRR